VGNPVDPALLDRIVVGEAYTFDTRSTATVDEKALRVIADAGLILLPFSTFDNETGLFTDFVQLVSLGDAELTERGSIEHVGFVRRADMLDTRLWVLSDQAFQSVDIDDLDAPTSLAALPFIGEQELLDSGLYGCAENARGLATRISSAAAPSFCGVLGLFSMFALPLGYLSLRRTRSVMSSE
jgi:hypothetical protein